MSESFILEFLLQISAKTQKIINGRLDAARYLYNTCLGEALKRVQLARESVIWHKARTAKDKKLFRQALKNQKFSEYDFHTFVKKHQKYFAKEIDSATAQKIASRSYLAVSEYLYGKRGRPRFKGKEQFVSVEGKSNEAGIRFKDGKIFWKGLILKILFDKKDKYGVEAHGLLCRTKYVRLIRRKVKKREKFYVQLIQEGKAKIKDKNQAGEEIVGLDIGPSTIAYVSKSVAGIEAFGQGLIFNEAKKKKLQVKLARKRRIHSRISKRYKKCKEEIAEITRKVAATRKKLHGYLANRIIKIGKIIKTEKLSYRSFQKNYGRSVNKRAPGKFLEILRRKAENAGGKVIEFSPYKYKLSSFCHKCGSYKKKKLSERHHICECGVRAQRDLYSAYLAQFVNEDKFDSGQAKRSWPGADMFLERALSKCEQGT